MWPIGRPSTTEQSAAVALEMDNYYVRTQEEEWAVDPISMLHDDYDNESNPVRRAYGTWSKFDGAAAVLLVDRIAAADEIDGNRRTTKPARRELHTMTRADMST